MVSLNINNLNRIDWSGIERLKKDMPEGGVGKMSAFVRTSNEFPFITRNKDTRHKLMSCNSVKSLEVWNAFSTTNFCVACIFYFWM